MRLQIFSDCHIDVNHGFAPILADGVDAVVVAGDICPGLGDGCAWLRRHIPAPLPILLVAGNHEFYGRVVGEERAAGRAAADEHAIHLLDDASVEIAGVRFVGSTLWTDYEVFGAGLRADAMRHAARLMLDHRLILESRDQLGQLTPERARRHHFVSRGYLEGALRRPHAGPTVVVTHHVPHRRSIAERYARDLLTAAFASDLSGLVARTRPALWVHGHTHTSFDYREGDTRIVCNPRGYGEENPAFDPALVIEV